MNNLGGTKAPMLHTKLQDHQSTGSGVEDF